MTIPDQRVNDRGGLPAGPIDRHEHANTLFEKRVDALYMLMSNPAIGAFRVDALRRAIETCSPDDYVKQGYYEKWIYAIRDLLLEQDVISQVELEARLTQLSASVAQDHTA